MDDIAARNTSAGMMMLNELEMEHLADKGGAYDATEQLSGRGVRRQEPRLRRGGVW